MKSRMFFIAGTDTGVGKTVATCALSVSLSNLGCETVALKPVAAGCDETENGLRNEDALLLQKYSSVPLSYEQINPFALKWPASPHIAATQQSLRLSAREIAQSITACQNDLPDKMILVEGAGGWHTPVNDRETLADVVCLLKIPVVLVVGLRLGCLNHALLTAQAIERMGLKLSGWMGSTIDPQMQWMPENIVWLEKKLKAPKLGILPYLHEDRQMIPKAASFLSPETLLKIEA